MEDSEDALALGVRSQIYTAVENSPGLHFRELQRRTGIAVGSLQYHLGYLEKKRLIRAERNGKFMRYFSLRGKQLGEQSADMALLRQESIRRIVLFLMTHKRANNAAISKAVSLSPPTTSWHLNKLLNAGMAEKKRRGRKSFFYLTDKNRVAQLLVGYRKSFLDEMVDNFVEIWSGI